MKYTVPKGKVWLVGAGPGDPELLTLKAYKIIQSADLILFDQLVSNEIRELFPKSIPAFYVGKQKDDHSIAQKDLNALLVKHARLGKNVCRIKGGDPFVFGRGGEELLALLKAGVAAEVIPGITAASGCSNSAGIPLTHRGLSQGCTFVTAHGETEADIQWQALVAARHTLVFYMGLSRAEWISQSLMDNGMDKNMPVAIVENGSRKNQRVVTGKLFELADLIDSHVIQSPAIIIVGEVVNLAHQLYQAEDLESTPTHRLTA
jgi:uroporphyrin-III C-methyltransferase